MEEKEQKLPQNNGRQVELDLAKALAIIFMIMVHTYEAHGFITNNKSGGGFICSWLIEFLGGVPAAPVFMFAMGVGVVYSKHSTAKTYLIRAAQLFALGILVNFFQQWVPIFLSPNVAEEFAEHAHSIIATDIYSFVTITFLYFAFLKKTKHPVWITTVMIIICAIISELMYPNTIATGNNWIDSIIGIFIRTNEYSYFPFFTWIFWPLLGYLFGNLLIRTNDKKKMYIIIAITGIIALIISSIVINWDPNDMIVNSLTEAGMHDPGFYYAMDTWNIIWAYGELALEIALLYVTVTLTKNRIPALFSYMSSHIMSIYVFQWAFIGFGKPIFDKVTNVYVCILISAIIFFLTLAGAKGWELFMKAVKKK